MFALPLCADQMSIAVSVSTASATPPRSTTVHPWITGGSIIRIPPSKIRWTPTRISVV